MPITQNANKIDSSKPFVALTFDDGPSIYTTRILDTLQQHGGRASFFVTGNSIKEHKNKIYRASQMDCEIICHAWDHINLTKLSARKLKKQLVDTITEIAKVTGKASYIYRPPYGDLNDKMIKVSRKLGLAIVTWSLDPRDWESRDADAIYSHIASEVNNGDIILCHDVYDTTAEAMSRVIPDLIEHGCQLVTVSELLQYKYGELEPGRVYTS